MELIIIILACIFFGYVVGVLRTIMHLKHALIDVESKDIKNLEKQDIPILNLEKHGDMLYLFEKSTDIFMCQGSSLEDLAKKLSEYKDIHIAVVDNDSKPVWLINGKVSEVPYEG